MLEPPPLEYPPEVDLLFKLGSVDEAPWQDYAALGIRPEHQRELVDLLYDYELDQYPEDDPTVWARVHAWRALASVCGIAAWDPLCDMLLESVARDDEWYMDDFLDLMSRIGRGAVEPLLYCASRPRWPEAARRAVVDALATLGQEHPETRAAVVDAARRHLLAADPALPELNGCWICACLDLKAVECAEAIERAFANGAVELSWAGDWEEVRRSLGVEGLGLITADSPKCPDARVAWQADFRSKLAAFRARRGQESDADMPATQEEIEAIIDLQSRSDADEAPPRSGSIEYVTKYRDALEAEKRAKKQAKKEKRRLR